MSRGLKIAQIFIFVISTCICLIYSLVSVDQRWGALAPNDSAKLSSYSPQSVSVAETLAQSLRALSPSYAKSEPLLLLLSGIAMFIGATTVRKAVKKTSSRGVGQEEV